MIKTKAAVLWEPQTPWSIEEVELDPPKEGEVLLKLAGSGMCHSDEHLVTGDLALDPALAAEMGLKQFPIIGGHEGAGEVLEVGPGVTNLAPGDHVALGFIPSCGRCVPCSTGKQNLCDSGAILLAGKQISDMTSRHRVNGEDVAIFCCIGTFSPHTVVNEFSCIKIDNDIPLDKAALVGCGVTTGWGSATYAADVTAGESVVVIGCGGVGMNAVQGAAMAGARHVVAVDTVDRKLKWAEEFGATHTAESVEAALGLVTELTHGIMADKAIITTGEVDGSTVQPVMSLVGKGGRVVLTSVAPLMLDQVTLNLSELTLFQKQLVGTIFGNANPRRDIPHLLRLYQEGLLKLDELVTNTYPLEDINQGYQDMRDGENIRGMLIYD